MIRSSLPRRRNDPRKQCRTPSLRQTANVSSASRSRRKALSREITKDLELACTDQAERRRLYSADPERALPAHGLQDHGRHPRERQVENLVGLAPRHSRVIEASVLAVRRQAAEGGPERLRIFGREDRAQHLAPEAEETHQVLADRLALTVTVGCDHHAIGTLERTLDGLETLAFAAAGVRLQLVAPSRRHEEIR